MSSTLAPGPCPRRRAISPPAAVKLPRALASWVLLYGVGPVTSLALTCWLGGAGRFSSSRKAVRVAGPEYHRAFLRPQRTAGAAVPAGPPVLRWAAYEVGKTHARAAAPDYAYYAAVKDRKNSKRAARPEACKIVRQACHILTELGDDALTAV